MHYVRGDWLHRRCKSVTGNFTNVTDSIYIVCTGNPTVKSRMEINDNGNESLQCIDKFCYLGDMSDAGGGSHVSSIPQVRGR